MANAVYVTENANILLFLAHLSRNQFIINELLGAAARQFSDIVASRCEEDVEFLDRLCDIDSPIVVVDCDIKSERDKRLQAMDDCSATEPPETPKIQAKADARLNPMDPIVRMNAALKMIQLLGQILRNFPGSLTGPTKFDLARTCCDVAFRTLAYSFGFLSGAAGGDICKEISELLREHYPHLSQEEARKQANLTVVFMARLVTFGVMKRIANAIGARELSTTYKKLLQGNPSTAYKLANAAIGLDHFGAFPIDLVEDYADDFSRKPLALSTLRDLVIEHFYLFPVGFQVKQSACHALGLSYQRVQALDSRRLLVGRHPSKR